MKAKFQSAATPTHKNHSRYSAEDISQYIDKNMFFVIDKKQAAEAQKMRDLVEATIASMPTSFQRVIIEQGTKFVAMDKKSYKKLDPASHACAISYEIYFPPDVDAESLRHEIGHVISGSVLKDSPKIRQKPIREGYDAGSYSGDKFGECCDAWLRATKNDVANAPSVGMHWWLARRHDDILYDGDESTIEYLKELDKTIRGEEAFAEITRKYLSLYALHQGNEEVVVSVLSKEYPNLWRVWTDEVPKQMDSASDDQLRSLFQNYKGAFLEKGKFMQPVSRREDAWTMKSLESKPIGFQTIDLLKLDN